MKDPILEEVWKAKEKVSRRGGKSFEALAKSIRESSAKRTRQKKKAKSKKETA